MEESQKGRRGGSGVDRLTRRVPFFTSEDLGNSQSAEEQSAIFRLVLSSRLVTDTELYSIRLGQIGLSLHRYFLSSPLDLNSFALCQASRRRATCSSTILDRSVHTCTRTGIRDNVSLWKSSLRLPILCFAPPLLLYQPPCSYTADRFRLDGCSLH